MVRLDKSKYFCVVITCGLKVIPITITYNNNRVTCRHIVLKFKSTF